MCGFVNDVDWTTFEFMKKISMYMGVQTRSKSRLNKIVGKASGRSLVCLVHSDIQNKSKQVKFCIVRSERQFETSMDKLINGKIQNASFDNSFARCADKHSTSSSQSKSHSNKY